MKQKKFKIGGLKEIEELVEKLNKKEISGGVSYELEKVEEQEFLYLVKEKKEDYEDCAIIEVKDGVVFAISEDVYKLLLDWFLKVL